jgi:glycosyltransferase involved in cell wall biosynthesis
MILNIVEPTLNSYAGHCFSLVEAIAQAVPSGKVRVWAGIQSRKLWEFPDQIRPYFFQTIRKFQSYFLYKKLLREPGKVLLSTAGSVDFLLLDWAASGNIPKNKVYLYVHWLGAKKSTSTKLARLAQRQPNLEVLCTTHGTTVFFKAMGFRSTTVAYPKALRVDSVKPIPVFHHLLFAGAARMDKGFDRVADLVEYLTKAQESFPFWIQTSATHQKTHTAEVLNQIERLKHSGYPHQTLLESTLNPEKYRALFIGGISIQPYSESDFEDRVSGVTLDAFAAGCPVIVPANTWLGHLVVKHNAGIAIDDLSPSEVHRAIIRIVQDYEGYAQRAYKAGFLLSQEHSAVAMMQAIFQNSSTHDV